MERGVRRRGAVPCAGRPVARAERSTRRGGCRSLRSILTEAGSDRVHPSILMMHVASELCRGLRVESGTFPKLNWPWEVAPWSACPDSHVEALAQCTGAFSDGTQRDKGDGLFSGFRVAWAHAGVTVCTKGVFTCGSLAFRGEGAGAGVAIEDHANRRPGTVLHLHSDCMGVLERIWCMSIGIWDDTLSATDGSAPLWRTVHRIVVRFQAAGCRLVLHWIPGHTAGRTDLHLGQDLCDALCDTLRREDSASLCEKLAALALDFNAVLWDDTKGRCSEAVCAWLKGARWKVLAGMREKKRETAPSWELTWRSIAEMVTGPEPVLLGPVAVGSRSNGRPVKSVIGETDISSLAAAAAFDMRWLKVLNGRSLSSVTLDASATLRPCPGTVRDASCLRHGLDTPMHLFGDDHPSCPLGMRFPCFLCRRQRHMSVFRFGATRSKTISP